MKKLQLFQLQLLLNLSLVILFTKFGFTKMPDTKLDIRGYLIPVETLEQELAAQGYVLVPAERMQLASISGYVKRYHELMTQSMTYSAAWEKVEWEFQSTFGCKRFESHDSFRNSTAVKKVMGKE